jgi:hypothetical protein
VQPCVVTARGPHAVARMSMVTQPTRREEAVGSRTSDTQETRQARFWMVVAHRAAVLDDGEGAPVARDDRR